MASRALPFCIREYQDGDAPMMARVFYDSVRELGPRRYRADQVAAWAAKSPDPAALHARAADGRTTLIAINAAGEIIAWGDLETDGHIDNLYCRPDAAGTGVASDLLDDLIRRASARGLTSVHTAASELARGLFERAGFVLLERRDFTVSGVAIHHYAMERRLA
jgi:ribosomal protein S18 acetylase RimI-like enzyme